MMEAQSTLSSHKNFCHISAHFVSQQSGDVRVGFTQFSSKEQQLADEMHTRQEAVLNTKKWLQLLYSTDAIEGGYLEHRLDEVKGIR